MYIIHSFEGMHIRSEYSTRIRRFVVVTVSKAHMERSLRRLHNTCQCVLGRRALGDDVRLGHWFGDELKHWVTALLLVEQALKLFRFAPIYNFCLFVMQ